MYTFSAKQKQMFANCIHLYARNLLYILSVKINFKKYKYLIFLSFSFLLPILSIFFRTDSKNVILLAKPIIALLAHLETNSRKECGKIR